MPADIKYKSFRLKQLREKSIIHSSEVTKCAKSLIVKQSTDKKKDKAKKEVVLDYLVSDIFCLFIDEFQDMGQDFFDLIQPIIEKIDNYYFVGDTNQAILSNDCYKNFALKLNQDLNIKLVYNLMSRRVPASLIPLCNRILPSDSQMSSCSEVRGKSAYLYLSELTDEEKALLVK